MACGLRILKSGLSRVCFKDKEEQLGWIFFSLLQHDLDYVTQTLRE